MVHLTWDDWYLAAECNWGEAVEVPDELLERWRRVGTEFCELQDQIHALWRSRHDRTKT